MAVAACAGSRRRPSCDRRSSEACARPTAPSGPDDVPRAGRHPSAAHRGADPRRRHGHRGRHDPPVRARLLRAAPQPEGRRDRPGAEPRPLDRGRPPPRRRRLRPVDRLRQRRHRRVPARHRGRAGRPARLHRDEPAHPGRAHRDREVTDVDLVQSQMRIAAGETLTDLGLSQDTVSVHGAALQTRITTEDPTQGFRPDTGKITTYRSPGGAGVRLDGGTIATGAQISPHFDSMLAKMTCRGRTSRRRCPGEARPRRVPDPRRQHEHPVPAGRPRGPGLRSG